MFGALVHMVTIQTLGPIMEFSKARRVTMWIHHCWCYCWSWFDWNMMF